ncbi:MAG: ABC transporter permease [Candidatus Binatia bacterium]|nr:ABC transporter permease [Candidatus Binatia bacterium]
MTTQPLGELWRQRELLASLTVRDLRSRYAGSSAGLLWAVLNPLIQLAILTTVFSLVLQIRLGGPTGVPFAVTLAWGFLPWLALQEGLAKATTSLVDGGVLVRRMAFRPEIVVVQPVLAAVIQQMVGLVLLIAVMPLLGDGVSASVLLCIIPLMIQIAFGIGIGWILGVLHVYFRDTAQVVTAALQAWFYLTPIVYTLEVAPASLRGLLSLNPLCGIVEGFRGFAVGAPVSWGALAYSAAWALAALLVGAFAIDRARSEISDLV